MEDETKKTNEIASLFARIGADAQGYSAAMQAVDRDLVVKRIAELGLDPAIKVAAIAGLAALKQLKVERDKTDSSS